MDHLTDNKNGDVDSRLLSRLTRLRRWMGWMSATGASLYALPLLFGVPESISKPICLTGFGLLFVAMLLSFPLAGAKCPRCKRPFYMPEGAWTFLVKYNPFQRRCTDCQWSIRGENECDKRGGTNAPSP
jgi:hypothetical protein